MPDRSVQSSPAPFEAPAASPVDETVPDPAPAEAPVETTDEAPAETTDEAPAVEPVKIKLNPDFEADGDVYVEVPGYERRQLTDKAVEVDPAEAEAFLVSPAVTRD